jgi:hypothetical protein
MKRLVGTKFCFKLGRTPTESYEILRTVCDDEALSRSCAFERFEDSRDDLQDDPRSGRPTTSRNEDRIPVVLECRHDIVDGLSE